METNILTQKQKIRIRDFRQLLQEELLNRCRKNPNYSLRAFARSLKIEPSALSQILNGKRPITEKMKLRLGSALGLSVDKLQAISTAETQNGRRIARYEQMTLDSFALISDWYHYAIIELASLEGFKSDATWISQRLGITKSEVNIAVERLFRLGLLEEAANGDWKDTAENGQLTHIEPGITSDAARKYQSQLLDLSKRAIQEVDISKRNHTSATLCFDPEDLPQAIQRISEFRRKFGKEFQPKNKGKEVYQLQISFFPLTKQLNDK